MGLSLEKDADALGGHRLAIEASWRRCASYGLDRGAPRPGYVEDRGAEALVAAAAPVLDRLGGYLAQTETSIYLSDPTALMVERRCSDPTLARKLDRRHAAPGFRWSEELTGTTGLGTALETRELTVVSGDEHYIREYAWAVDAAAPVMHPITRRLAGALGVTCPNDVDVRHLSVVLQQAVWSISDRLYEDASDRERLLLRRFLEAARHGTKDGVVLLNERMVLTNPAAARLLEGIDNGILWEQAVEAVSSSPTAGKELHLAGDATAFATFERIDHGTGIAGVLVKVKVSGEVDRSTTQRVRPAPTERRSSATEQLDRQVLACAQQLHPVLLLGDAGVGKLHTAGRIHAATRADCELRVLDAALVPVRGEDALLQELAGMLSEPAATVVIRHAEFFGSRAATTVGALLGGLGPDAPRVMATADPERLDSTWLTMFPVRVEVPRLRDRIDDLPLIVRGIVERLGGSGRVLPTAMQALSRHEWHGNVRELEAVVGAALEGHRTADLTLRDLPEAYQDAGSRRRLSRIEQSERAAIVRALQEAGGNRTRAAEIVGIGRATLYRKMRSYGLDLESVVV